MKKGTKVSTLCTPKTHIYNNADPLLFQGSSPFRDNVFKTSKKIPNSGTTFYTLYIFLIISMLKHKFL